MNKIVALGNGRADLITGRFGHDEIAGMGGNDTLIGAEGDDTLMGAGGEDALFGGEGADFLRGGKGDDTLVAGTGNDTIEGGAGRDRLIFSREPDWANVERDIVRGFERDDTLDLTGLSDGTLTVIGADHFTGAGDEVRVRVNKRGHTELMVDADGDGAAEHVIVLQKVADFDADALLL